MYMRVLVRVWLYNFSSSVMPLLEVGVRIAQELKGRAGEVFFNN